MKRIISIMCVILIACSCILNTYAWSEDMYSLSDELSEKYPYRESQTTIKYAPWYTMAFRSTEQFLQGGQNAGEGCQVVGVIAFSDVNPNHVIAGFDTNGIAISTDGGENWYYQTSRMGSLGCNTAFWHPTDENIVYRASQSFNGSRKRFTVLEGTEDNGLLRSKDCGKTWENILPITMHTDYSGTTAKFDELGNLYALTYEGLFRSSDDGDTWEQLNKEKNWSVHDLAISSDGQTIITAAINGLNASFDGGKTWEYRNGRQFYGNTTSIDIDPLDEKHWVTTFAEPYLKFAESFDCGKTWNVIASPFTRPWRIKFGGIRKDGSRYMYAVGTDGGSAYSYSVDNGQTWLTAKVDTKNGKANSSTQREGLGISRKHPDIVWYAFGDGINCSYDGGIHFFNKSAGHGGQKLFYKMVTDVDGKLHFPGTDTGYFHTETPYESGLPFPACNKPYRMWGGAIALSPHNPKYMLLASGSALFYSYDMGENWTRRRGSTHDFGSFIEFHKTDKNIVYCANAISYDAGLTWVEQETPISYVSCADSNVLFSRTYDAVANKTNVKISYNCGESWEDYLTLDNDIRLEGDKFNSKKLWLSDRSGGKLYFFDGEKVEFRYDFNRLFGTAIELIGIEQNPKDENHLIANPYRGDMQVGFGLLESYDAGKTWHIVPGLPGNGVFEMMAFEERTNDIFLNGWCGIIIYDADEFRKYYEENAEK